MAHYDWADRIFTVAEANGEISRVEDMVELFQDRKYQLETDYQIVTQDRTKELIENEVKVLTRLLKDLSGERDCWIEVAQDISNGTKITWHEAQGVVISRMKLS